MVRFFAAVGVLGLLVGICGLGLGGLPHFLLTVVNLDLWSCLLNCLTVFNFATVNLSDFSHSVLISLIICLETISLFRLLGCCRGQVVRFFAAVRVLGLLVGICGLGLGGLPHFLLTVVNLDLWSCLLNCLTVFNFATVNLSDFSCSVLISLIICLETISLFRLLGCCRGQVVRFFAAVGVLGLLVGICGLGLGGLPHFL